MKIAASTANEMLSLKI